MYLYVDGVTPLCCARCENSYAYANFVVIDVHATIFILVITAFGL